MKDMLIYNLNSRLDRIQKRLEATKQQSSGNLDAMRAEIPNIFRDLIVPVTSQIEESILSITAGVEDIRARIDLLHPPPTYSYARYAIDVQGTGFTKTFNPAIHTHRGIYVSSEQLTDSQITADLFIGLWEPYAPLYTYTRYASDAQGTDFSSNYVVGTHTHRAVLTRTYLSPSEIVVGLFAGLWQLWSSDDVYDGGGW